MKIRTILIGKIDGYELIANTNHYQRRLLFYSLRNNQ